MQNLQDVGLRAGRHATNGERSRHTLDTEDSPSKRVSGAGSLKKKRKRASFEKRLIEDSKHVLVIDDDYESAFAVKTCLESQNRLEEAESRSEFHGPFYVTVCSDPTLALLEFQPRSYDLLLIDIDMPSVGGYVLAEKIQKLDPNIKICFMSAGEINYEVIRESLHTLEAIDCFIRKTVSCADLISRILHELR